MKCRTQLSSWQELESHQRAMSSVNIRDLFVQDPNRFKRYSLELDDILFDFSKNLINDTTLDLFASLADQVGLNNRIDAMFLGDVINTTENRSVLHTALRNRSSRRVCVYGHDVMPKVARVLDKMRQFSDAVRSGAWRGYTGKAITNIVNIGIGGSDLGPRLVIQALDGYSAAHLKTFFISGVDPHQLEKTFQQLDPETTLFIVASKSFSTTETMLNAQTARTWLIDALGEPSAVANHFVAVSANVVAVRDFGIDREQMFELWDWVGGRYSLWSAIGLPIALAVGMDRFEQLLDGAYAMDEHFRTAPWKVNIPVVMALLGVWYNNFFSAHSHAVLPYDSALQTLPAYLQQLDMESNGKHCSRDGELLNYASAPVVWGQLGMDGQHAFFQLLHQGTSIVPCDFLCAVQSDIPSYAEHHRWQLINCVAQSKALLDGKTAQQVRSDLSDENMSEEEIQRLIPHKIFPGNRPSNSILYRQLTPRVLGSLLAMYEHRTFVQGVIWNVNSFDQWGVELGKSLAKDLSKDLTMGATFANQDASTSGLLTRYLCCQQSISS